MQRLDDIVQLLKAASVEDVLKSHGDFVNGIKRFSPDDLDRVLSSLDPSRHASAVSIILCTKVTLANAPLEVVLQQVETFLNGLGNPSSFSRHFDAHQVCIMMRYVYDRLIRDRASHIGLDLFKLAIRTLQESPSQLTEIHAMFLQLCLDCRNLKPACDLLLTEVYEVVPNKNCDAQGYMQYFFYGSVALASCGFFISALRCIETVLFVPGATTVSNTLVTDSYKKYLLLALLSKNKAANLPKVLLNQLESHLKKAAQPYLAFSDLFQFDKFDIAALDALVTQHQRVYTTDRNIGLVKHCLRRYRVRELIKYAKVFENVELNALMTSLQLGSLEDLELLLLELSSCSGFIGSIDQVKNAVMFKKKTDMVLPEQAVVSLQHELSSMQKVVDAVWNVEKEIVLDTEFLKKALHGECGMRDDMSMMMMGMMDGGVSSGNGFGLGMGMMGARSGRRTP